MAKPDTITAAEESSILGLLRKGNTRRTASLAAGVLESRFYRELRDPEFLSKVTRAEEEAVAEAVSAVATAGPKSWQAAAWWLERRRAQDWRPGAQAPAAKLNDEQLLQVAADIVNRFGILPIAHPAMAAIEADSSSLLEEVP